MNKDFTIGEIIAERSENEENDNIKDMKDIYRMSKSIKTEEIIKSNQKHLIDIALNKGFLKKVIKIQSYLRMIKYRRIYSKQKKNLKYRVYVIKELIMTEEIFVKNLDLIYTKVMVPSLEKSLLGIEEYSKIFSNLQSIMKFNLTLYDKLKLKLENFSTLSTKIADVFFGLLPYFKLYFCYCNNFEESSKFILKMRKESNEFIKFIETMEYSESLKNMDLPSFLVMPVQRLPKYVLLFKDLLKHTEKSHPDYKNIAEILQKFIDINEENNKKIANYIKNLKLFELQKMFESEKLTILTAKREFIAEEALNMISDSSLSKSTICYFLSDLILITEIDIHKHGNNHLIQHISLNSLSKYKDQPDTKVNLIILLFLYFHQFIFLILSKFYFLLQFNFFKAKFYEEFKEKHDLIYVIIFNFYYT